MKTKYMLVFILTFYTLNTWSKNCGCGSYENGTYSYIVGDKEGCCTGTAEGPSMYITYEKDKDGVWTTLQVELIEATKAQKGCCSK